MALAADSRLVEGPALVEDLILFNGPLVEELVRPLEKVPVEVDKVCSLDIVIGTAVVLWRLDGCLGGELGVFGGLS